MPEVPSFALNNGSSMPQVGFGVWQVRDEETEAVVTTALEAGYRSIDTATLYGNEAAVGAAIRRSEIPREELFVTTKVWNSDQGREATLRAYDESLRLLGLERVDLYLIHWPIAGRDLYVETWKAFEELYQQGRIGAIGVSNFTVAHLQRLLDECEIVPAVNQVELNPYLQQRELRVFHAQHGICTEAWAPIGKGGPLLRDAIVQEIADATRRHHRAGRAPVEPAARQHRDPEVGHAVADHLEPRPVLVRAHRRRDGAARRARP